MRHWLRGKPGGFAAFVVIAALVAGGLGWATAAALDLERAQLASWRSGRWRRDRSPATARSWSAT